jgi:hypothetical protein
MRHVASILLIVLMMALAGAHGLTPRAETAENQDRRVQIEWRVPTPQLAAVEERLDFTGDRIPERTPDRSPPLFIILAGLVSLPSLAEAIALVYRELIYGGVIIDACGEKLEIHNDHALPGEVVLVRCGKDIVLHRWEDLHPPELVQAILETGTKVLDPGAKK